MALTMGNNMIGNIDIQKYGIRSVSMISEATWLPRILIKHLDGKEFSYVITREYLEDLKNTQLNKKNLTIEDKINDIVKEHIRKECIVKLRKEKLLKLNEI
jgi:hypothetical protein